MVIVWWRKEAIEFAHANGLSGFRFAGGALGAPHGGSWRKGTNSARLAHTDEPQPAAVLIKGSQAALIRFRNLLTSSPSFAFAEPLMEPGKMETAFRHVIDGRRIVARQRERVEMLARSGHDTTESERTLDLFACTLDIFEDDLRRMLAEEWKEAKVRRG
jgi:hypothetical protein